MKSIDTYLCRNIRKPFIVEYDHEACKATFSDGSVEVVIFERKSSSEIYGVLVTENPKVQVKAKMSDGLWPLRLAVVALFGLLIYKGLSQ